jgi:hypothetical protein
VKFEFGTVVMTFVDDTFVIILVVVVGYMKVGTIDFVVVIHTEVKTNYLDKCWCCVWYSKLPVEN